MRISIIVPVYNEENNVAPLAAELAKVAEVLGDAEIIMVDDGSTDGTWRQIEAAMSGHPQFHGIRCPRNTGQSAAMLTGFRHARGDILVIMDGDLQNNPEDIPRLIQKLETCDVVCGYRAKRRDSWSRRVASRIGNAIRNAVTHDGLIDTGCSLKAFRKECAADLPPLNGVHRFMGAYFKLHGRRIKQLAVDHRPRIHGTSKYTNLKRLPRTVLDLLGFYWYRKRLLNLPAVDSR